MGAVGFPKQHCICDTEILQGTPECVNRNFVEQLPRGHFHGQGPLIVSHANTRILATATPCNGAWRSCVAILSQVDLRGRETDREREREG